LLQFPFLEGRRQAEPDPRDRPDQYSEDDREPYNLIRNFWQQDFHSRLSLRTACLSARDFRKPLATRRYVHLAYFLRANLTKARYDFPYRLTVLRSMADIIA